MTVGEKIKTRRSGLGYNQRHLADLMEYKNNSTIARIEAGEIDLPVSKLMQFANVLHCSVCWLLDLDGQEEPEPVLTAEEESLIQKYRNMNQQGKEYIQQTIGMAEQIYKKSIDSANLETSKVG